MLITVDNYDLEQIKNLDKAQKNYEAAGDFTKSRTASNLIDRACRKAILNEIARIDKANKREQGQ